MKFRSSIVLAMALAGIIAMSSCVKNYKCQCTIKYTGAPGLPDSTVTSYDVKDSKDGAKSKCEAESFTKDENGVHTEEKCALY